VLVWIHYGSTNETYKIAYEKQAFTSRSEEYELYQVRELQDFKATSHHLRSLWFLSWEEGSRFGKKDRKEAEERKSKEIRRR
jgi:hypothetical protein